MAKTIKGRVQHPAYTAAELKAKNPVLLEGEIVYESDTTLHKVGDGVTPWNALAYARGGGFEDGIPAERINQDSTHRFVTDAEKSAWNNPTVSVVNATSDNYTMNAGQYILSILPKSGSTVSLTLPSSARKGRPYRIFKRGYFDLQIKTAKGIYAMGMLGMLQSVTIKQGALITAIFDGTAWIVDPQQ